MVKNKTVVHRRDCGFKGGECFDRMSYLFRLGDYCYDKYKMLSKIYIGMMKDISKRNAIKIDKKVRKLICLNCNNLLYKDKKSHMMLINKSGKHAIEYTCANCGYKSSIIIF